MRVRVPGDKSISQRALILSSLAEGESRVRGLLTGGDPVSTASALRALGVAIPATKLWKEEIRIRGLGLRGYSSPTAHLDLGNSGHPGRRDRGRVPPKPSNEPDHRPPLLHGRTLRGSGGTG
jgi:3-phosphoshikimate 1-carboxyvinyltransferase